MSAGDERFGRVVYLVANQLVSRALTFVLNALVVRAIDPSTYGVATVRLNLVLVTAVSLVRDTLRQVAARVADDQQLALNLAWLAPVLVALVMVFVQLFERDGVVSGSPSRPVRPGYGLALALYSASSVIEAAAEPAYVSVQARMLWGSRALVEGSAHLARCLVTYALLRVHGPVHALRAFAVAQVVYALIFCAGFWLGALWRGEALAPRLTPFATARAAAGSASDGVSSDKGGDERGGGSPARLLAAYAMQQAAKFALTHGESMVLLACVADAEQGAYSVVMSLGSLLARFVLEPAEETAFAQLAPHARAVAEQWRVQQRTQQRGSAADGPEEVERAAALERAGELLARVARRLLLLALVFAAFGPAFSRLLLQLIYGSRWSVGPAPSLLASYCLHIPAMALNGILESAVRALATAEQLGSFNRSLALCALAYWLAMLGLIRAGCGLHGVVLANALNLSARAVHHVHMLSSVFASRRSSQCHNEQPWVRRLLPTAAQAAMLVAAAIAVCVSALRTSHPTISLREGVEHVSIGALNFAAVAYALLRAEDGFAGLRSFLTRGLRRSADERSSDGAKQKHL